MSTQLSKPQGRPNDLKHIINQDAVRNQFALVLPKHLSVDRFVRIATTALLRTPKLAECSQESFVKCLLELSAWGIEPDGRRAHLIPFKDTCTLILDWKGLAELAQRSGQIAKLHADLVCENDEFAYNLGSIEHHRINFRQERGAPYAAYAMAETKDGAVYVAVLTKDEILSVRDNSQGWIAFQNKWAKSSPWDPKNPTSEGEMWKKTAFRRLSKWLPLSPEFRDAVDHDDDDVSVDIRNVTPAAAVAAITQNPHRPAINTTPEPEPVMQVEAVKAPEEPGITGEVVTYNGVAVKEGTNKTTGKPFTKYTLGYIDGNGNKQSADTFSSTVVEPLKDLPVGAKISIEIEPNANPKYAATLQSVSVIDSLATAVPLAEMPDIEF